MYKHSHLNFTNRGACGLFTIFLKEQKKNSQNDFKLREEHMRFVERKV